MQLDFIGIGASKSATSWIAKCLDEHPAICMYSGKEARFFHRDDRFEKGTDFYKSLFEWCPNKSVKGEYSVGYLKDASVSAPRIASVCPHAKLIVSLRNPIERVCSSVLHGTAKGRQQSLNDMIKELSENSNKLRRYLYTHNLRYYLSHFSREQMYITLYDDIENDPLHVIQQLYLFLGVDQSFVPSGISKSYNTSAARISPHFRVLNKTYLKLRKTSLGRSAIGVAKATGMNAHTVEKLLRATASGVDNRVTPSQHRVLQRLFIDDIKELEQIIDRDLSNWLI
jgi:hypothetical protein